MAKLQHASAAYPDKTGKNYEERVFYYNHITTANALRELNTDLIREVAIRGFVVPKAALSSWIIPHGDGTFSAWIDGEWSIVKSDETVRILFKRQQTFKDQIARASILLHHLQQLDID